MERGLVTLAKGAAVVLPRRWRHGRVAEPWMTSGTWRLIRLDIAPGCVKPVTESKLVDLLIAQCRRRWRWRRVNRLRVSAAGKSERQGEERKLPESRHETSHVQKTTAVKTPPYREGCAPRQE